MSRFKYIFVLAFFSLTASSLQSQIYYGFKGVYHIPFVRSEVIKVDDFQDFLLYKISFLEQSTSPALGAFVYYRNDLIYLQGEVTYRQVKARYQTIDFLKFNDLSPREHTKRTNFLAFPLTAGIRINNIKLGTGPVFSFLLSDNEIFGDLMYFEEKRNKLETSYMFNLGLILYRLHIDLSYEYHFSGIGDPYYFKGVNKLFDQQWRTINLGIGYLF